MKKSFILVLVLMFVTLMFMGCNTPKDEDTTEAQTETETQVQTESEASAFDEVAATALANDFFFAYTAGDYEAAYALNFSPEMKQGFTPAIMETLEAQLKGAYGAFQEQKHQIQSYHETFFIVSFGGIHENKHLVYNVVIDEMGQIAGFNFNELENVDQLLEGQNTSSKAPELLENETLVTFGNPEFLIQGTLAVPNGDGPFKTVILVHGSGPNDRDETIYENKPFRDLSAGLTEQGIAVLRYDKRTFTHGVNSSKDANYTIYDEVVDDAQYALDYLSTLDFVDNDHMYVVGHSLGANQAPRIAEGRHDVAGLILMAGNVTPLQDLVVEQVNYLTSLIPDDDPTKALAQAQIDVYVAFQTLLNAETLAEDTDPSLLLNSPVSYWMDLRLYNPAKLAATLDIPILVLQGERDYQVPPRELALWESELGNRAKYILYPSLNHLFMAGVGEPNPTEYQTPSHVDEQVIMDIANWIKVQ